MGWSADLPEDVAKKIDEVYAPMAGRFQYGKGYSDEELEPLLKKLFASLIPDQATKFKPLIEARFHKGCKLTWKVLSELAAKRANKEYDSFDAFATAYFTDASGKPYGDLFHPHNDTGAFIKSFLMSKCFAWTDTVYCFDTATGRTVWKKEFPGDAASNNSYYYAASSTPAIAEGKCFVLRSAALYCIDVKTGTVAWQTKTGYSNSSPLVTNGVVYVMAPYVSAFDVKTGKPLWTNTAFKSGTGSVVMWSSGGRDYLIGVEDTEKGQIFCVKPQTGATLWTTYGGSSSTPVVVGDIMVMRYEYSLTAFTLSPAKPEILWTISQKQFDERGATPVVYNNSVFSVGGHGRIWCVDLKTGGSRWVEPLPEYCESFSPVVVDGKVYSHFFHVGRLGATIMFRATPDKFERLGDFQSPNSVVAAFVTPTIAGGKMFVRLVDTVACYDLTEAGNRQDATSAPKKA